jgi:hypothetical protein
MLTMWHPLATKVGSNFADKRQRILLISQAPNWFVAVFIL